MTKPKLVTPLTKYPDKTSIDPESIKVIESILEDLKRKVADAEDLLRIMRQEHLE